MNDDELLELLDAYLDGETTDDETAAIDSLLARSEQARAELDGLRTVRTLVRDLPAVEPPFGFYERMLRAGEPVRVDPTAGSASAAAGRSARGADRSRRRMWPRALGAGAAAAAAVILIMGVTPVVDTVIPPVSAYAQRHEHLSETAGAVPAPTTIAPATTAPAAATTTSTVPDAMGFDPMAPGELVDVPAPYVAPPAMGAGTMPRLMAFHTTTGIMHVVYGDGEVVVSVYEQPGSVAWDRVPAGGTSITVNGDRAMLWRMGAEQVLLLGRGRMVYTVVTGAPQDTMMSMANELPAPPDPSAVDRAASACRAVVVRFALGE